MSLIFPIYVAERGKELPKEGTYYVVARDKFFLHKDTGIVKALVEVDSIAALGDLEPYVQLRLPKLPPDIVYRAWKFFNSVFKRCRSESAVVLHYNMQEKNYYMHCPEQVVSHASVHYDLDDRFEDYQLVGTIHSHCDFDAFHSGTDIHDEEHQDGIHITLGHVNTEFFSASGSLVVNGTRFEVELENAALGVRPVTMKDAVNHVNIIPVHRQNRYQVTLSDEEKEVIDQSYGTEIEEWVNKRVNPPQTFHRGYQGHAQTVYSGGGGANVGAQHTAPSRKQDSTFTYRVDPTGKTQTKGWFNDAGEELVPQDDSFLPEHKSAITTTTEEDWDAESVLAEHGLFPSDDDDTDVIPTEAIGTIGGLEDPDLQDLTIVPEAEIDDGITNITRSSEAGDDVDNALKKADEALKRTQADNAPDAELAEPTDDDLAKIETEETAKGKK